MFCSQCGAQAESGARFCGVCGKKMAASAPAPAVVVPPVVTAAPVKRGISIWLKVILGGAGALVLLLVGAVYAGNWAVRQMEEPVQAHLEAIRKDDLDAAYALTSAGFHENVPQAAFLLMAKAIQPTLRQSAFVVTQAAAANANAGVVTGELVDNKGKRSAVAFTVVQEQAGWRVHEIDLDPQANNAGVR